MGEFKLNGPMAAVIICALIIGGCTISNIFAPKMTPEQIKMLSEMDTK